MSHFNKNASSRSVVQLNKKFCKVCKDAGKCESEYTSHNVRDLKSGQVLCPFLLAQKCLRCFKPGHTTKYCKVVAVTAVTAVTSGKVIKAVKVKIIAPKNVFSMFESDSEEEEEEEEEVRRTEPAPVPIRKQEANVISYKSILETPKKIVIPLQPITGWVTKRLDWANPGEDSDSEDEEE